MKTIHGTCKLAPKNLVVLLELQAWYDKMPRNVDGEHFHFSESFHTDISEYSVELIGDALQTYIGTDEVEGDYYVESLSSENNRMFADLVHVDSGHTITIELVSG